MEKLARDKHSSFLRKSANYGRKIFYSTVPWKFIMAVKSFIVQAPVGYAHNVFMKSTTADPATRVSPSKSGSVNAQQSQECLWHCQSLLAVGWRNSGVSAINVFSSSSVLCRNKLTWVFCSGWEPTHLTSVFSLRTSVLRCLMVLC